MGRLVQVNRPEISGKRMLYKYTVACVPTSQLKSQPLRGRVSAHDPRCECWRAPTGLLILSVRAYSPNHNPIDSQFRFTCQRVNFARRKTRWVRFYEQRWVNFSERQGIRGAMALAKLKSDRNEYRNARFESAGNHVRLRAVRE